MAEVVKKYALLYDKQKNGYRDEAVKAQTWQKVANECDVGTGKKFILLVLEYIYATFASYSLT